MPKLSGRNFSGRSCRTGEIYAVTVLQSPRLTDDFRDGRCRFARWLFAVVAQTSLPLSRAQFLTSSPYQIWLP
jgi:hypothetical protein